MRFGGQQAHGYHGRRLPVAFAGHLERRSPVERVRVEEARAVEADAREHGVVERPLERVGEPRFPGGEQQAPGQHHARDRRAGLGIGAVRWQLEGLAEGLVPVARAEGAGQVGPRRPHVVPAPDDRSEQLRVAGLDGDVDDAASRGRAAARRGRSSSAPRARARGPASSAAADPSGTEEAMAAPLDQQRRESQVALLAGGPVELDERHLDLGVPVDRRTASSPSAPLDVAERALGDRRAGGRPRASAATRRRPG